LRASSVWLTPGMVLHRTLLPGRPNMLPEKKVRIDASTVGCLRG
jgi:hypothetical protein